MTKEEKVKKILDRLYTIWPHPRTALEYSNPYQSLVATILSAQSTDAGVNKATPELFKKYPSSKELANAKPEDVFELIKNVNFAGNKSQLIIKTAQMLEDKFKGVVPNNMEDLDSLPGVARKTANVVLGNAFKIAEGIVVDTHVMRLTQKLKLTDHKDPVKIEQDLMKIVPKENWIDFSHLLINFGRAYCPARPHKCDNCPLGDLCPDK